MIEENTSNEIEQPISVSRDDAYKNLASAIIMKMFIDIDRGYFDEDFILSDWFLDLCELARVCIPKVKQEAYRRFRLNPYCKVGSPPITYY